MLRISSPQNMALGVLRVKLKEFLPTILIISVIYTLVTRFIKFKKHGYISHTWEEAITHGAVMFFGFIIGWYILTLKDKIKNRNN